MVDQVSAEWVKQIYPKGAVVEVVMIKSHPTDILAGTRGEVICVDDAKVIHIRTSDGRTVTALYGEDYIKRIIAERKRK